MKTLTPVGFARLIKRGVDALQFHGDEAIITRTRRKALVNVGDQYCDMAMNLALLVEAGEVDKSEDAEFLDAVATELDRLANPTV